MGSVINPDPHDLDPYLDDQPPAPILETTVRHKLLNRQARLRALLDTGADWSQLSPWGLRKLEEGIGPLPQKSIPLDGTEVPGYELLFSFDCGANWYGPKSPVECVLDPDTWPGLKKEQAGDVDVEDVIVGRDILRFLEFCCNGPSNTLTLKDPAHCQDDTVGP